MNVSVAAAVTSLKGSFPKRRKKVNACSKRYGAETDKFELVRVEPSKKLDSLHCQHGRQSEANPGPNDLQASAIGSTDTCANSNMTKSCFQTSLMPS